MGLALRRLVRDATIPFRSNKVILMNEFCTSQNQLLVKICLLLISIIFLILMARYLPNIQQQYGKTEDSFPSILKLFIRISRFGLTLRGVGILARIVAFSMATIFSYFTILLIIRLIVSHYEKCL